MIGIDAPLLAIDIGRGTQDILVYDPDRPLENSIKLVLPSPTEVVAAAIRQATLREQPVFLEGHLMGGGANVKAVRQHLAAGLAVSATREAAATIHDDLDRVRALGIRIADNAPTDAVPIHTTDYMERELRATLEMFAVEYPAKVAVAVQDHGYSPHRSNRIRRFELLRERLDAGDWHLDSLITEPPLPDMTRMRAILKQAPGALVTDTGPVALIGALCDPWVRSRADDGIILVNVGNGHTLCCTLKGEEIYGFFEHHTASLDPHKLQHYIWRLADGLLTSEEIFDDGGHGAAVRKPLFTEIIAATGPNRQRFLPDAYQAAPFGDMMLTGSFGLLKAWERIRQG
ncbi:pyruvate formate lyase-activating protein [Methanoculleus sp. FWC-SCC1]|uniref:Pyruvate formate lyase-activating protein n=1 Tax=Methanoculleus frigidifontis TaxID=2584085 RepID=A0ABT8M9T9_9EURY|nr:DUF1786 domain-containing protein [Methanoculleus sp. FWC-SCC1]MDN7024661.1 pyruvate formate lyase-activating protein [Methanoculleus sp. FWC-SCC1]